MKETVFKELAGLSTEARNPETMNLDRMSVREILEALNREDRQVPETIARALPQIEKAVELVVRALQSDGRLIYVGAGTSGRLGVLDAAECPPTFGTEPHQVQGFIAGGYGALVRAVEGCEDDAEGAIHDLGEVCCINKEDIICGISASRRTPYVMGALSYAGERGAKRILLICNEPPDGSMKLAEVVISLPLGPEVLTGSTRLKAGTATKLVLNMITTAAWVRMGKCYENLMVDLRQGSQKLQARARRILIEITGCDYDWADELLRQADGELKVALVMHFKNITADHARDELVKQNGEIRRTIE